MAKSGTNGNVKPDSRLRLLYTPLSPVFAPFNNGRQTNKAKPNWPTMQLHLRVKSVTIDISHAIFQWFVAERRQGLF